ncbi:MAG: hypothetical protein AAGE52_29525 [Myxococcota bacterium]
MAFDLQELASTHDAICRGQWFDIDELLAAADDPAPETKAWTLAFRAAQALTRGGVDLPQLAEVEALPLEVPGVARAVARICDHAVLGALAAFDLPLLRRWATLAPNEEFVPSELTALRLAFAAGDHASVRALQPELQAHHQLEAACLKALVDVASGQRDDAREAARWASRHARMLQARPHRFVASLVLARTRRCDGRSHLASRIADSIQPVLPAAFRGWLRWEQLLCGEWGPAGDHQASSSLRAMLEAALQGQRDLFETHRGSLLEIANATPFLAPEIHALTALIDPDCSAMSDPVRAFVEGESHEVPFGLTNPTPRSEHSSRTTSYVLHRPGRSPRRVLLCGAALAPNATPLPLTRLRKGRLDLACAVIALAREPLSEETLFRACHGFRFARHLHEGALSMLVSRVRERFEGHVEVHRKGGQVWLHGAGAFLVPDPRSVVPIEQSLLALIARTGSTTTRVAARSLGVSLRSVQSAVATLVKEGELAMDRSGRSIGYRVDDTSFSDLTPLAG